MKWILLLVAGLFEITWAIGIKYTNGFTRLIPSILTLAAMVVSMYLVSISIKFIPVGTAYAVWTGIGAAGTAILSIWLFKESTEPLRLLFIGFIIVGIIGLKFVSSSAD